MRRLYGSLSAALILFCLCLSNTVQAQQWFDLGCSVDYTTPPDVYHSDPDGSGAYFDSTFPIEPHVYAYTQHPNANAHAKVYYQRVWEWTGPPPPRPLKIIESASITGGASNNANATCAVLGILAVSDAAPPTFNRNEPLGTQTVMGQLRVTARVRLEAVTSGYSANATCRATIIGQPM